MPQNSPDPAPDLRQMAREEFLLVAKLFFAPVYGAFLALREVGVIGPRVARATPLTPPEDAARPSRMHPAE